MPGIGGGGFMGLAFEVTAGTYVPPTKFFAITSESLQWQQDTTWRRTLRQNVDAFGAVAGNGHIEGDIAMEALEDVVPYFLYASRCTVVKSGSTPNFIYTCTPNSNAIVASGRTLSITVVRNGVTFGYVGCVVSSFTFGVDNQMLTYSATIIGNAEASQTLPTATFTAGQPFGSGTWTLEIPTATQVFDVETFEFQVEDNAEPQYRLKNALGAQFVKYGERTVTLNATRDFETRTEYDAFKALTAQAVHILATKGINNSIDITMPAAIKDTWEMGLSGQGDLIQASIAYMGTYDSTTSRAYQIVVKTQENIT
jgi:hypothetical protein